MLPTVDSVGDFVIREILYTANSRTYAVEADFEAQASAPAVSTIGVTIIGSGTLSTASLTVDTDSLEATVTVTGASVGDSITFTPTIAGSEFITSPSSISHTIVAGNIPASGAADITVDVTFTVVEDIYTANVSSTYTIEVTFNTP